MDLYQKLAEPLTLSDANQLVSEDGALRPVATQPGTRFTETVESTDEERAGALLGSIAP